jgi:hypothetical protein
MCGGNWQAQQTLSGQCAGAGRFWIRFAWNGSLHGRPIGANEGSQSLDRSRYEVPMKDRITPLIAAYIDLESRVQEQLTARCAAHCRNCRSVCCKIEYCRESLESPFLVQVRKTITSKAIWHPENGWLGDHGCVVPAGRPPVCYAFCCEAIMASHPTPLARYALNVLAHVLTYAGRRARGNRHLVELNDLNALNTQGIIRQVNTAESLLDQLDDYWSTGKVLETTLWRNVCRPVHER